MPYFYRNDTDEELQYEVSPALLGVKNVVPAAYIAETEMPDAQDRISTNDGVNRPRPGYDQFATVDTNVTRVNGVMHLNSQTFLVAYTVNSATAKWAKVVGNPGTVTILTGPAFDITANVDMATGNNVIYFVASGRLCKWDGTTFTNNINLNGGTNEPTVAFPQYFTDRVIVTSPSNNTVYFSDFLDDSKWDIINLAVQVDNRPNDNITGMRPYQKQALAVFKASSIYLVDCNPLLVQTSGSPTLANVDVNQISNSIGCCSHNTIAQSGNDVFFLSESGRGVYSIGQVLTNPEMAIKNAISRPLQKSIDLITWVNVIRSQAIVWEDFYILNVPTNTFDSLGNVVPATAPNSIFTYCISLNTWQGQWNGYNADKLIRQESGTGQTDFIFATQNGNICRSYHTADKNYLLTVNGNQATGTQFSSSLTSKAYRFGETWNLVQPYNFIVEFTDSSAFVSVSLIHDNVVEQNVETLNTSLSKLTLPIAGLPFDLDPIGLSKFAVSARRMGLTNEMQIQLSGTGSWSVVRISATGFISRTVPNK